MNLTDDAVLMAVQQGTIHGNLKSLRLPRQPKSKEYIQANPIYRQLVESSAKGIVESQGPGILYFADDRPIRTVLDIGCGSGFCSLSLYRALDPKPSLFLCDGIIQEPEQETVYCATFARDGKNMVTDMRVTYNTLLTNGVRQEDINLIGPSPRNIEKLRDIDLVVSNVSWCYHYPPEVYWEALSKCMHNRSVVKVDIRIGPYADSHPEYVDFFRKKFHVVLEMGVAGTAQRPDKTLSIIAKNPR